MTEAETTKQINYSTKEGRIEVYKEMREFLKEYTAQDHAGFCRAIIRIAFKYDLTDDDFFGIEFFPELLAYEPKYHKSYWWDPNKRNIRINILTRIIEGKKPSWIGRLTRYRF